MDWEATLSHSPGWINPRLDIRFDESGRFLPEAGNTVVCQVIPRSRTEQALARFRKALEDLPHAHLLALTPQESWHMTVFEGVVETRRDPLHWPQGIALDASLPETTAAMTNRLDGFTPPPLPQMRIVAATPFGVTLQGLTAQDDANARLWRDRLSQVLGLQTPQHAAYRFHTTLAYAKRALPAVALPIWRATMQDWTARLQQDIPAMDLAPPAFCRFSDMCAFLPIRHLA
jgi:hypothetical protein